MNKFIKKYKSWIMVIGGSMLMIAWLLPSGLTSFSDQSRHVEGTLDGRKVRFAEWQNAASQFKAINTLIDRVSPPGQPPVLTPLESFGCKTPEHFFLLAQLAQREGFIGGKADSDAVFERTLETVAAMIAMQDMRSTGPESTKAIDFLMSFQSSAGAKPEELAAREAARQDYMLAARERGIPNIRQSIMAASSLREDDMDNAIATYRGIQRMFENYFQMAKMSDRRVIDTARRFGEASNVEYLLVGAERLASRVPAPTPEEIAAHYEQYKNTESGTGEFGLGYRKPDRVKVEWVEINKTKVAASIRLNEVHVRERWDMANPGGTTAAFATARADFELTLRNEYAEEIIKFSDAKFRELAGDAARKLTANGKFRVLPADWKETRFTMDKLAAEIAAAIKAETTTPDLAERWQSPVEIELPLVNAETGWLDSKELQKLSGIGASTLADGNRTVPFPELALGARELDPAFSLPLQVGVIPVFDRTLSDRTGNHFYFRVTAARPKGEPEGLDEVREQVVIDIKKIRAFALLSTEIDRAGAATLTGGLDAAVSMFSLSDAASLTAAPISPLSISKGMVVTKELVRSSNPMGTADATALNIPAFRDAITQKAFLLDPRLDTKALPAPDRTVWMSLPASLSGVVARIESISPVTVELIRARDAAILNGARQDELGDFKSWIAKSPFGLETLRKNLNFKRAGSTDESTEAGT
jgi:hypothetical protein